jgi:hypothetical protein
MRRSPGWTADAGSVEKSNAPVGFDFRSATAFVRFFADTGCAPRAFAAFFLTGFFRDNSRLVEALIFFAAALFAVAFLAVLRTGFLAATDVTLPLG